MSGILNTKQRILDTIVTQQGRQSMALGKFRVEFVTFTDSGTFYRADLASGSEDPTNRLFFECSQLPQDQVTFVADDSGRLAPLANHTGFNVRAGQVFSGSSTGLVFVTGSEFSSTAGELLGSSIDNFGKLLSIGTIDPIFEDDDFRLSHSSVGFVMTDENPINDPQTHAANVNHLDSFFADPRFSRLPNFRFLPPINRVTDTELDLEDTAVQQRLTSPTSPSYIASYTPLGTRQADSYIDAVLLDLATAEKKGNVRTVKFDPTTNGNNLAIQVFEMHSDTLLKLDVLEFGRLSTVDPLCPDRRVFFAGKVFLDDKGSHTFVRLFTLVLE
jgi:hypothetical protein